MVPFSNKACYYSWVVVQILVPFGNSSTSRLVITVVIVIRLPTILGRSSKLWSPLVIVRTSRLVIIIIVVVISGCPNYGPL